jgi:hypothetical protein
MFHKTISTHPVRFLILTLVLSMVGLLSAPVSAATQNNFFPISFVFNVPCAAGGAGELVSFTGNLHNLFTISSNANGGFHFKVQNDNQGVSGTGSTTGAKYQAPMVSSFESNLNVGSQETFVDSINFIGQGPGNNFLLHDNFHMTINANGVVTSFHILVDEYQDKTHT